VGYVDEQTPAEVVNSTWKLRLSNLGEMTASRSNGDCGESDSERMGMSDGGRVSCSNEKYLVHVEPLAELRKKSGWSAYIGITWGRAGHLDERNEGT
jgi:hypothetical protein